MTGNDKTRLAGRVCHCVEPCFTCACESITPPQTKQPMPDTALCAFLRRYRAELDVWREHHGDRQTQGLIDCCSVLLREAERGRHGA
jgi:hypothetical protein